jgi:Fe-S cluster biogenesis protein NfuA
MEDKLQEVEKILKMIRPALDPHHGNIKLVDVKENVVYLQFEGGCSDCPVVDMSIKNVIDASIKGNLRWVKKVEILYPKINISSQ